MSDFLKCYNEIDESVMYINMDDVEAVIDCPHLKNIYTVIMRNGKEYTYIRHDQIDAYMRKQDELPNTHNSFLRMDEDKDEQTREVWRNVPPIKYEPEGQAKMFVAPVQEFTAAINELENQVMAIAQNPFSAIQHIDGLNDIIRRLWILIPDDNYPPND